jgi:hypothetical protein
MTEVAICWFTYSMLSYASYCGAPLALAVAAQPALVAWSEL